MHERPLIPSEVAELVAQEPVSPGDSGKPEESISRCRQKGLTPCPPSSWEKDWVEGEIIFLGRKPA